MTDRDPGPIPPWLACPDLKPILTQRDSETHGAIFIRLAYSWLNAWVAMTLEGRQQHLEHWQTSALEFPPPWFVLPQFSAWEGWNQGVPEAFLKGLWYHYWDTLSEEEQEHYLTRWDADPDWRERIAETDAYVPPVRIIPYDARAALIERCAGAMSDAFLDPYKSSKPFWRWLQRQMNPRPLINYLWLREDAPGNMPPPWHILPDLQPEGPIPLGLAQRYIADYWRPIWTQTPDWDPERYYRDWNVPEVWQNAIARWTNPAAFDAQDDATARDTFSAAFAAILKDANLRTINDRLTYPLNPLDHPYGGIESALKAAGFDPHTVFGQELQRYFACYWPVFWKNTHSSERYYFFRRLID